jgi:hypothetical protein
MMNNVKYLKKEIILSNTATKDKISIKKKKTIYKKNPWVVDNVHPRLTSSVVVTFVQVIHRERSCPARRDRMNLFVQTLLHRAAKLFAKAPREV